MRTFFVIIGSVVLAVFLFTDFSKNIENFFQDISSIKTCKDLSPRIIKLSKENQNPFASKILKMYEIRESAYKDGAKILNCTARAKWDRGGESIVNFHLEKDKDGDYFIGYKKP